MITAGPQTVEPSKAVLVRGLQIFDCFSDAEPVQTVSSIAESTGLPPSTVHRTLATLIEWGGVERISRGRYRLGLKLWRLGSTVQQARVLRDVALPFLEDLYEATHEVIHLAVVDKYDTLYVEKISGRHAVTVSSQVGKRIPLHGTGPGKVLLAYAPSSFFDEVVANGLTRLTDNTITDAMQLRRALAEIRRTGVAISRAESSAGTASVAAPIFDGTRQVVASVSVVMPDNRLDPPALIPAVTAVARAISRGMGAPPVRSV